jgi:UDP-2,3-diacylglucosamine hydrolase
MTALRLAPYHSGAEPVTCAANQAFLLTDLHLAPERPQEIAALAIRLHDLTASTTATGRVLIVMGDLFDAYTGPEDWDLPAFAALREAFRCLRAAGVRVFLLRGNRDVMLEPDPSAVAEIADSVLLRLPGRAPALITHGDAFCLADRRYQLLRRTLRRPGLRQFLLRRGPGIRRWLAARLRGVSRGELARKPLAHLDVDPEVLEREMRRLGAAWTVVGHLHQDRRLSLADGLRARVLPAWDPASRPWDLAEILDGRI